MKVRIDVNELIYVLQCLTAIKVALDAGQVEQAKSYVTDLMADVNDGLEQL